MSFGTLAHDARLVRPSRLDVCERSLTFPPRPKNRDPRFRLPDLPGVFVRSRRRPRTRTPQTRVLREQTRVLRAQRRERRVLARLAVRGGAAVAQDPVVRRGVRLAKRRELVVGVRAASRGRVRSGSLPRLPRARTLGGVRRRASLFISTGLCISTGLFISRGPRGPLRRKRGKDRDRASRLRGRFARRGPRRPRARAAARARGGLDGPALARARVAARLFRNSHRAGTNRPRGRRVRRRVEPLPHGSALGDRRRVRLAGKAGGAGRRGRAGEREESRRVLAVGVARARARGGGAAGRPRRRRGRHGRRGRRGRAPRQAGGLPGPGPGPGRARALHPRQLLGEALERGGGGADAALRRTENVRLGRLGRSLARGRLGGLARGVVPERRARAGGRRRRRARLGEEDLGRRHARRRERRAPRSPRTLTNGWRFLRVRVGAAARHLQEHRVAAVLVERPVRGLTERLAGAEGGGGGAGGEGSVRSQARRACAASRRGTRHSCASGGGNTHRLDMISSRELCSTW